MDELDEKEWAKLCEDSKNHNNKRKSESGFVSIIRILAFVTFLGGIIGGFITEVSGLICFISGFISAVLWWALSIIVEACQHYLKTK